MLADDATNPIYHDEIEDCEICSSGKYSEGNANHACSNCVKGKHLLDHKNDRLLHDLASVDCKTCKSGEYSPLDGSTVCTSCVAGKYLSDTGAIVDQQHHMMRRWIVLYVVTANTVALNHNHAQTVKLVDIYQMMFKTKQIMIVF